MDGDGPKVIWSQSWSESMCQFKSHGDQPAEAGAAARRREVGEQSRGTERRRKEPHVFISWFRQLWPDDSGVLVLKA